MSMFVGKGRMSTSADNPNMSTYVDSDTNVACLAAKVVDRDAMGRAIFRERRAHPNLELIVRSYQPSGYHGGWWVVRPGVVDRMITISHETGVSTLTEVHAWEGRKNGPIG